MKLVRKYKYIIGLILLIIIIALCLISKKQLKKSNITNTISEDVFKIESPISSQEKIKIDIKGAVINPGVYELEIGSRVIDSIMASGGLKDNANTSLINLSKKLVDEMVVIVYTNEEVAKSNVKDIETVFKVVEKECNCPNIKNDGCLNTELDNKSNDVTQNSSNGLVNINTASVNELTSLEGVGEQKAKAIIEYREINGDFKETKDIMNVSGIGESVYNKIKESITT